MGTIISAETIKITEGAKKQLFRCTNETQVEKVFTDLGITDIAAKIELIRCCMQVENVYAVPGVQTPEETYREDLSFFVEGAWRQLI
ncbi:hypothetical protein FACS1894190_16050 [Spirochaetia bacterium]|nr:hypothetical protein FACS1894190_16050 [Spirochaetia bacterium]